mmetsp:Transcript_30553/g.45529  ORF Transcript_30553/g.45529 Transcript_30553/m.45529 type:complete len:99 (-) Transcript_30553:115-411(-)
MPRNPKPMLLVPNGPSYSPSMKKQLNAAAPDRNHANSEQMAVTASLHILILATPSQSEGRNHGNKSRTEERKGKTIRLLNNESKQLTQPTTIDQSKAQ